MTTASHLRQQLSEIIQCAVAEIECHRQRRSAVVSYDIGREKAAAEWLQEHFPAWKRTLWNQAMQAATCQPVATLRLPKTEIVTFHQAA